VRAEDRARFRQLHQIPADREGRNPEQAGELVDPELGLHGSEERDDFVLPLRRLHLGERYDQEYVLSRAIHEQNDRLNKVSGKSVLWPGIDD
jgi:hypothetical protein